MAKSPKQPPAAPVAQRRPVTREVHGVALTDEYAWLRDRDDPAVLAYLKAENGYTDAVMRHTRALQERLYGEMLARIVETDLSVPEADGGWLYYTRTEAGKQYTILCRRRGTMDTPEEILLDENRLAEGKAYFDVGALALSPDHRLLAYTVDDTGGERHELRIRDLASGADLPERVPDVNTSLAWSADGRFLFYVTLDHARRPYRLWRHRVGTDPLHDVLMHHEDDDAFFVGVHRSKSRQWLFLSLGSHATSEVRALEADRPEGGFRLIARRRHGIEYDVVHHGDRFLIVTNEDAVNFRLFETPTVTPTRDRWRELLPHRDNVKLDGVDAFARHLVIYEREDGLPQIRIQALATGDEHRVRFPEPVYSVNPKRNPDFDSTTLRLTYTSLVTPASVIDYGMDDRSWTLRKQTEVKGGYDPAQYRSERVWATARDGVLVPVSLVYRLPLERDGTRPAYLQGYGSYGVNYEPAFSSNALSLLDRGFVVAIAHIRGGEELGRRWYESGKLEHKQNTFDDFAAAADFLVAEGYTSPARLAAGGGSAGGLLMGAVANRRPDLFGAIVAEVPFVDVVNTMLDPTLPLTVIEYDEWGNPGDEVAFRNMLSYSPYDNVAATGYPNMLVTAGLNDPRVAYWEPAKWVARLRARRTDARRLLLRTHLGAGHGGSSGRYDYLREVAFKYAFLLDVLGVAD